MTDSPHLQKLTHAYDRMMQRVQTGLEELEQAEREAIPALHRSIEKAARTAVELEELTHEEAQLISSYLKRDLQDAGHYLNQSGKDLRSWLQFDLELIEDRLLDLFTSAADKTRLEMLDFEEQMERAQHYHTGEITGPGTLICDECGSRLNFHATAHIPPCAACHGSRFSRDA